MPQDRMDVFKVPKGIHKQFAKMCTSKLFVTPRNEPQNLSGLARGKDVIQDALGNDFYLNTAILWIRNQLESEVKLTPVPMRKPDAWFQTETTGAMLYEFTAPAFDGGQIIYVKLQHVKNKLLLWSFHK
jgi:hypothetical protein